jgi:Tfp pilus assembly protein PilV
MTVRANPRNGITLVEIVVALVVFSVGILGLAPAMFAVVRQARIARIEALATDAAANRLERLIFTPCAALTSGSEAAGGVVSTWTAGSQLGSKARVVTQDVQFSVGNGIRSRRFDAAAPCL